MRGSSNASRSARLLMTRIFDARLHAQALAFVSDSTAFSPADAECVRAQREAPAQGARRRNFVGGPVAELARGFSWALKSRSGGAQHSGVTLVLYDEFVLRKNLPRSRARPGTKRRLPSLFSHAVLRVWIWELTLNGHPYVLGATPFVTGSGRELDFDSCMLRARGGTSHELGGVPKHVVSTNPQDAELAPSDTDTAAAGVRDGADAKRIHPQVERRVADDGATPVEFSAARWDDP
ncbi:hypothetical protein B0H11DRAFT_2275782 [Mycena galericulata]|nr:hypothetical protein B0H11DRAFT_2275782 [Mycena galericulata]